MYALSTATIDDGAANFYNRLATLSWTTFPCWVLYFIIYLTGKEGFLKKTWHHIALFFPALVSIYFYFFQPVTANDIVRIAYDYNINLWNLVFSN